MASSDYDSASRGMDSDMAEHERTYRGFLLTLKLSGAVTAATLILMYFFLAR